jgi:hypothetical protein
MAQAVLLFYLWRLRALSASWRACANDTTLHVIVYTMTLCEAADSCKTHVEHGTYEDQVLLGLCLAVYPPLHFFDELLGRHILKVSSHVVVSHQITKLMRASPVTVVSRVAS